jgi:RHS repeat-associated protein
VARYLLNQAPLFSTWDGWREAAEYQPGSTWQAVRAYVWGGRIDELIRYSRNDAGTWVHYHPQQDHQDSVDLLVDAAGIPREKCEYDPFGAVTVFANTTGTATPTWGSASTYSAAGNPYTFTGRRLDLETGLMYYRNRYYSPPLGRFVTGDPIGLWGDVHSVGNPYAYGGSSPAFLGDPMGLQVATAIVPLPAPTLESRAQAWNHLSVWFGASCEQVAARNVGGLRLEE